MLRQACLLERVEHISPTEEQINFYKRSYYTKEILDSVLNHIVSKKLGSFSDG